MITFYTTEGKNNSHCNWERRVKTLTLSLEVKNLGSSPKASDTSWLNLVKSSSNCSTYFSESWNFEGKTTINLSHTQFSIQRNYLKHETQHCTYLQHATYVSMADTINSTKLMLPWPQVSGIKSFIKGHKLWYLLLFKVSIFPNVPELIHDNEFTSFVVRKEREYQYEHIEHVSNWQVTFEKIKDINFKMLHCS